MTTVTEEAYQGQESFRIAMPDCTYIYHRQGCGFAALIDRDGNDWISYRPEGGERGHFRGIPNMALDTFGHPGYAYGAASECEQLSATHVRITSRSLDDRWRVRWDLHPEGAIQSVESADRPYWWLYEGTPGGHFRPEINYRMQADGRRQPCTSVGTASAQDPRWVAFGDPACGRLLILGAHTPEAVTDTYWPKGGEGGMTVFGFGREDEPRHAQLAAVPAHFSFALVDSESPEDAEARFARLNELLEPVDPERLAPPSRSLARRSRAAVVHGSRALSGHIKQIRRRVRGASR